MPSRGARCAWASQTPWAPPSRVPRTAACTSTQVRRTFFFKRAGWPSRGGGGLLLGRGVRVAILHSHALWRAQHQLWLTLSCGLRAPIGVGGGRAEGVHDRRGQGYSIMRSARCGMHSNILRTPAPPHPTCNALPPFPASPLLNTPRPFPHPLPAPQAARSGWPPPKRTPRRSW